MMRRVLAGLMIASSLLLSGCVLPPPIPPAAPSPMSADPVAPTPPESPVATASAPSTPAPTPSPTADPEPAIPQPTAEECQSIDERTAAIIERSDGYVEADPNNGVVDWAAMTQTSTDLRAMLAALRADVTHPEVIAAIDETAAAIDDIDPAIAEQDDLSVLLTQTLMVFAATGIVAPCQGLL